MEQFKRCAYPSVNSFWVFDGMSFVHVSQRAFSNCSSFSA
jgi:hypothetical protein